LNVNQTSRLLATSIPSAITRAARVSLRIPLPRCGPEEPQPSPSNWSMV